MRARHLTMMLAALAAAPAARAQQPLVNVRVVASDTLHDVALTRREPAGPVIYYNPLFFARLGTALSDFFLMHEYGHVARGHEGNALTTTDSTFGEVRRRQELEADCWAVQRLWASNRSAVTAAHRFFTRMGPWRHDTLHPTGAQRAANLLACIPAEEAAREVAANALPRRPAAAEPDAPELEGPATP